MSCLKIKNLAAVFIVIGGMVGTGSSYAATLSPGSTTSDALGIDGLVVDGVTYNITFENIGYNILYGCDSNNPPNCKNPPTFEGNEALANEVAADLATALNTLHVTGISGISTSEQQPYANVLIPFGWYNANVSGPYSAWDHFCSSSYDACDYNNPPFPPGSWAANWTGNPLLVDANGGNPAGGTSDFTLFTVANTPLPAALPLFATGLGAIGLLGWRRKRKASAAIAAA